MGSTFLKAVSTNPPQKHSQKTFFNKTINSTNKKYKNEAAARTIMGKLPLCFIFD